MDLSLQLRRTPVAPDEGIKQGEEGMTYEKPKKVENKKLIPQKKTVGQLKMVYGSKPISSHPECVHKKRLITG